MTIQAGQFFKQGKTIDRPLTSLNILLTCSGAVVTIDCFIDAQDNPMLNDCVIIVKPRRGVSVLWRPNDRMRMKC
jgi:hypothetical protein